MKRSTLNILFACMFVTSLYANDGFVTKVFCSSYQPTRTRNLYINSDGYPIVDDATNLLTSCWQIHKDAPLKNVARYTHGYKNFQRIELWTTKGIFVISAPNYGGRRLILPSKADYDYLVATNSVRRNKLIWKENVEKNKYTDMIFKDLGTKNDIGFVNIYYKLDSDSTWGDAEDIIYNVLTKIDDLRGFWLGFDKDKNITLHFHDIVRKEWKQFEFKETEEQK